MKGRNRLRLEVRLVESPELIPMIDGRDVLGEMWDGIGPDPDHLLGPRSPLIPVDGGRDVVLRVNTCGMAECASVIARVRRDGPEVVWDEFHFLRGPAIAAFGPFRFDAVDYLKEVDRADRERDWESGDRRTGRLVANALAAIDLMSSIGWELNWVGPTNTADWDSGDYLPGVGVFLVNDSGAVLLGFPNEPGETPERAARICEVVLGGNPATWPVVLRH